MGNRIVKTYPNCVLYHHGGNRYSVLLMSGAHVGPEIIAGNEAEAIRRCTETIRDYWVEINGKAPRSKAREILDDLESANYGILIDLDDDELGRLKNILFVWHDLANLEIVARKEASNYETTD